MLEKSDLTFDPSNSPVLKLTAGGLMSTQLLQLTYSCSTAPLPHVFFFHYIGLTMRVTGDDVADKLQIVTKCSPYFSFVGASPSQSWLIQLAKPCLMCTAHINLNRNRHRKHTPSVPVPWDPTLNNSPTRGTWSRADPLPHFFFSAVQPTFCCRLISVQAF